MIHALLLAAALQAAPADKTAAKPTPPPPAAAAPTPADTGPRAKSYGDLALSPDGAQVADVESAGARQIILVRPVAGGAAVAAGRVDAFCAGCRVGDLAWSPDGRALAYVARDAKAGVAFLVTEAVGPRGAAPRAVTRLKGLMSTPRWSADGRTLAVLATANPRKLTGATQAGAAIVGEIGSAFDSQRIAVVPATGGELRFVSPDGTFVYEYDWTPDGRGFAGTAAKGDGDNNWWVAKLEAFGLDGSERVIAAPAMQMNFPRVSADGRSVAFIGGLMSDFGSVGGDVYVAPIGGGEPRNLTPGYKGTFTSIAWRGGALFASALIGADSAIARIEPARSGAEVLAKAPVTLSAGDGRISLSADGRIAAAVTQDFEHAPAISLFEGRGLRQLTHDNDNLPPNTRAQSVTWTRAGFTVQGWLLAPLNAPAGKAPLLVKVHGGPAAASTPTYLAGGTDKRLLEKGYYIFLPNPRGSYGQGEAFVQANRRDFGGGDLQDILAGADAAAKVAPVDLDRMGVYGGSYGGFMSMWSVTHTNRFKASVASAGLSNWSSYYGTNGIDQWMIPYFGKSFYEDPEIYDKLSAVRYIKDVKTPTLIMVGERDIECPPGQSIEFWHGLKQYDVPTTLVIYEGEGHGIRDPKKARDAADRTIAWFDKYLAAR